jgi:uncharacterized protein (TIGR01777 family)
MNRVLVTGGTGFVGQAVVKALVGRGDHVTVLTRNVKRARGLLPRDVRAVAWDPTKRGPWFAELGAVDGVMHLAGESVAKRWSEASKARIEQSRAGATALLVEAIGEADNKPAVLVSASATGYYGANPGSGRELDEDADAGSDFLASVCQRWEEAARGVEEHGVRAVQLRIGVVFGQGGGALQRMMQPRFFVGGPIGTGDNDMSWVHMDDVVGMALMALDDAALSGPLNCTSPYFTTGKQLAAELASVTDKRALPMPEAVARLLFGDVVDLLVGSQRIYPRRAVEHGYEFYHARLTPALEASLMAD